MLQVDLLREGLLGASRDEFSNRYCGRRLVPVRGSRGAAGAKCYDDSGLTRGRELHGLLKQVLHCSIQCPCGLIAAGQLGNCQVEESVRMWRLCVIGRCAQR